LSETCSPDEIRVKKSRSLDAATPPGFHPGYKMPSMEREITTASAVIHGVRATSGECAVTYGEHDVYVRNVMYGRSVIASLAPAAADPAE